MAANTVGLAIAPLAPTLAAEATRLRTAGMTIVIAAAHAGGRCTVFDNPSDLSSCGADEEIFQVARELPGGLVDAIVAGHRHFGIAHDVAGIPIISSYSRGVAFGRIDLAVDGATGRVTDADKLRVAASDFLVEGGDGFFSPVLPLRDLKDEGRLVRDGIAGWIQRHGKTWRAAGLMTERNRRVTYPGTRPVRCAGQ